MERGPWPLRQTPSTPMRWPGFVATNSQNRAFSSVDRERIMMTASRKLLIAGLLLGCVQTASAQTADEIVERHLAATGGRAALAKLTARSNVGTITLSTPVGDLSGAIEVVSQKPNKERTLITLDLTTVGAGQMTFDQRFDGKTGFVMDPLQGNREMTGDQLEALKN